MNLFAQLPESLPQELVTVLLERPGVRIERIVSTGQASPAGFWYDQAEHEWVLLLAGSAVLAFEDDRTIDLTPGDYLEISAHVRHRVQATAPGQATVWLAIFWPSSASTTP